MQKSILFFIFTLICSTLQINAQESNLKFKGTTVYLGNIEEDKLPVTVSFVYINNSAAQIIEADNETKKSKLNQTNLV